MDLAQNELAKATEKARKANMKKAKVRLKDNIAHSLMP